MVWNWDTVSALISPQPVCGVCKLYRQSFHSVVQSLTVLWSFSKAQESLNTLLQIVCACARDQCSFVTNKICSSLHMDLITYCQKGKLQTFNSKTITFPFQLFPMILSVPTHSDMLSPSAPQSLRNKISDSAF